MFNTRQNFHHSHLPKLGEIVRIPKQLSNGGQKAIIESFPLCDNVRPYSIGIHTVNVRLLSSNKVVRYSGFYFVNLNE